jgi:hypothetical protein
MALSAMGQLIALLDAIKLETGSGGRSQGIKNIGWTQGAADVFLI